MVSASTFRESGFSQFVQKVYRTGKQNNKNEDKPCFKIEFDSDSDEEGINPEKKAYTLRDELLNRYMEGDWMTLEEIKYICMSS